MTCFAWNGRQKMDVPIALAILKMPNCLPTQFADLVQGVLPRLWQAAQTAAQVYGLSELDAVSRRLWSRGGSKHLQALLSASRVSTAAGLRL